MKTVLIVDNAQEVTAQMIEAVEKLNRPKLHIALQAPENNELPMLITKPIQERNKNQYRSRAKHHSKKL